MQDTAQYFKIRDIIVGTIDPMSLPCPEGYFCEEGSATFEGIEFN